jgi:SpoVK/Ycf46/Vps4 family AAA+-type ATPase
MATASSDHELMALGARRINTDTDPEELVLPEASMQRLRRLADWLTQPPPVLREWGLHRYIDGGLRALFAGPSGTGKTMAAIAIGRWSKRPLIRVDCAPVGTNLQQLFEAGREEHAILLFEDGDASGAGALLRGLEPFEGLAIIAVNDTAGLGEDAVSRLDGIVDFPMPDEDARCEIWRKLLAAAKLPKSHELDARALAKDYPLSGAEILRALRLSALLAAAEGGTLSMELLRHSAEERLKIRSAS